MAIHHAFKSFREIVDEFIESNKIDPRDVYLIIKGKFLWFLDNDLEQQFVEFHKKHAILIKMTKEQHNSLRKRPACKNWVPLDLPVKMNNVKREYPHQADDHLQKYAASNLPAIREMANQKLRKARMEYEP